MVVLSGYACDLYDRDLYSDWFRTERQHISDGGRKRTEILWMNDVAAARLEKKVATPSLFDLMEEA